MPSKPLMKTCPNCNGTGLRNGTGPGLCEGLCGGSGKVAVPESELRAMVDGPKPKSLLEAPDRYIEGAEDLY